MNRYTYRVYYEGGPTKSAPLRSTKTEQELADNLRTIPEHLEHHFVSEAAVEAQAVETHPVRGLSRIVTIVTESSEQSVDECVIRRLDGLDLFGKKIA